MTGKIFSLIIFIFLTKFTYAQDFVTQKYSPLSGGDGYTAIADMDKDGNMDIVVNAVDKIYVYYHDGKLPLDFKVKSIIPSSSYRAVISLVDKDGDGDMDILAVRNNKVIYIVNKSTPGNFLFEIESLPISFTTNYPKLLGSDFDNDGKMDILIGDMTGRIKIFYNKNGTYSEYDVDFIQPAPVEANLGVLKIADFNGDGMLDVVAGSLFASKKGLMVYINEGQSFKPYIISDKNTFRDIQVVDFDKDGDIDILTSGEMGVTKYEINLWINDLKLNNKFELKNLLKRQWYFDGFNISDLNKDGALDIIAGLSNHPSLPGGMSVYFSNGDLNNLTFSENKVLEFPAESLVETVLLADMDNDGDQDFIHSTRKIWVENKFKTSSNSDYFFKTEIKLYPNPVTDLISFTNTSTKKLKIYTSSGDLIVENRINPGDLTNVSHLVPGIYLVHLFDENKQIQVIKFIKQ